MEKETIELVKKMIEDGNLSQEIAEKYCPELKESEDEKIRKAILNYFTKCWGNCKDDVCGIHVEDAIAWLERQGGLKSYWKPTKEQYEALDYAYNSCSDTERGNYYEGVLETLIEDLHRLEKQGEKEQVKKTLLQDNNFRRMFEKPQCKSALKAVNEEKVDNASKVEPKFHEGDWVVDEETGCIYQIKNCVENVTNHKFGFDLTNGGYIGSDETNHYHRCSLSDAKDGDVLVCNINKAEIGGDVEKLPNIVPAIFIYEKVETNKDYIHSYCHLYNGSSLGLQNTMYYNKFVFDIYPATKEQRDLLFQKMKESGYEWDAEIKELRKIEQKPTEWSIFDYRTWQYIVADVLTKKEGIGQYLDDGTCKNIAKYMQEEWSKKLSTEQKPTWSEEDKKYLNTIEKLIMGSRHTGYNGVSRKDAVNWLKSLRPQNRWRPNEKQILSLTRASNSLVSKEDTIILRKLLNDLEKLTE